MGSPYILLPAACRLPFDVLPDADGLLVRRLSCATLTLASCDAWMGLTRRHEERSYYGPFG